MGNESFDTQEARTTIDKLKNSLQEKGWTGDPIIVDVDADGYAFIDEGNHRLIAAKELGMKEIPVKVEFGLAREGISRYNNADMIKNPTQIISKEEINKLKDIAKNRDYHIKYASIYLTDLGKIKQKPNENIQAKQPRAEVATEEVAQGAQPEAGTIEQPAQVSSKRQEIKSSLENLKDVGLLRSAITGKKDISQGEIDSQMALTDAMANVWKETTGRDDFYENFFNDVSQGDIDAIMDKGGILFQNIELPQRPLTRVSLGVFDLPEFRKMEGQEVSINSVKDLARTRGKQIEKDLMQTVLDYDKYKDAKKISYDEFKSDVEMQVMKLEKIVTSSYASYGADNLGDDGVYGDANTIIYNSPVDHGEYGHFRGDFKPTAIMSGTMTEGYDMSWNNWEVRQIPGTDQYAAVDKSMPDNVSEYELGNYIGTAGTKEQVEKWIDARKNHEGDINVGLFGHTRVWYDKGNPYYLAELQSDYFQKNDPNDLYASQIVPGEPSKYSYDKYNENDKERLRKRLEEDLGVGKILKIKESDLDISLILTGVIASYYVDNKEMVKKVFFTLKEKGLFNAFKTVLKKSQELKTVFFDFIESLGITLHKVTNILSYTFVIPLIPMLYNLTKQGIGSSNDIQEIIKRLTGFGLLTVSGILVKELITKIIRRFKQN